MGRLTRDPDVRVSAGERQMTIARYTLAVDRRQKSADNSTADFISCIAFDRAAEFAEKYFRQGIKVVVTGRIQTSSYTNRDGQKVYTTDVVVEEQEFAESKNAENRSTGNQSALANTRQQPSDVYTGNDGFMSLPEGLEDGGLPFT